MSANRISSRRKKKLKTLAKMMNKQNERLFPIIPPLLDMLDLVLTSEELDYLLRLGIEPNTYTQAASFSNMADEQFETFFDTLLKKGFIHMKSNERSEDYYLLNAIAVGWYEVQVLYLMGKPEEKEFSRRLNECFNFAKRFNFFPLRNLQNAIIQPFLKANQKIGIVEHSGNKTRIDINQPTDVSDSRIYTTKTVNDLIEEYGDKSSIAVFPCVCRHSCGLLDDPCRLKMPEESCIAFGEMGKFGVEAGYGRYISMEEALDVIREVRDKGAIHCVMHEKDDTKLPEIAICNCCWDCCGLLRSYNAGAGILKYVCYYSTQIVDTKACSGCGKCKKHCPTTAISIVDKKVSVNKKICIGCGQCVYQCPEKNVMELIPDKRTVFLPMLKESEIRIIN